MQESRQRDVNRQRLLTVEDAMYYGLGGISRSKFYRLIKDGELSVIKIGRRTLVVADSIDAFITRQQAT